MRSTLRAVGEGIAAAAIMLGLLGVAAITLALAFGVTLAAVLP